MKTNKINIEKQGVVSGIYTALLLTGYFMFMKFIGLIEVLELRAFSFVFLLMGLWYTIIRYKKMVGGSSHMNYLESLALLCLVTLVSVLLFTAFVFVYLNMHPDFMQYIRQHVHFGESLTPLMASGVVFMEGVASGFVLSYIVVQFNKPYESSYSH